MSHIENLDISHLDVNLLLVFEAMMELRSVKDVSEKLSLSQPNTSYALKKLRALFGDELFIRSARSMQPTAKAIAMHDPVSRVLEILRGEVLKPAAFSPERSRRTFVINMTELGELAFLPAMLKHFAEVAPGISIEPVCLGAQELLDELRAGSVDLGLGYFPELTARTVYVQTILKHPFICLAREGHPHAAGGLTRESYQHSEHVALIGEGHSQRRFEEEIEKSGVARRIRLRSRNYMSIPFIVRDTDLIATVPKIMGIAIAGLPGLRAFHPPFPIDPIPITQYWTERQQNDPGQVWLRRTVAELFLDKDPSLQIHLW